MEIYVNEKGGLGAQYVATGIDAAGAVQFADPICGPDGVPLIGGDGKPVRQVYQLAGPRLLRDGAAEKVIADAAEQDAREASRRHAISASQNGPNMDNLCDVAIEKRRAADAAWTTYYREYHPLNAGLEAMRPHGPRAMLRVLGGGVPSQRLEQLTDAEAAALVAKWQEHAEAALLREPVPAR